LTKLWPFEKQYTYVRGKPLNLIDYKGLIPSFPFKKCLDLPPTPPNYDCTPEFNEWIYVYCNCCYHSPIFVPGCEMTCHLYAAIYYDKCARQGKKPPRKNDGRFFKPPPDRPGEVAPRPGALPSTAPLAEPKVSEDRPYWTSPCPGQRLKTLEELEDESFFDCLRRCRTQLEEDRKRCLSEDYGISGALGLPPTIDGGGPIDKVTGILKAAEIAECLTRAQLRHQRCVLGCQWEHKRIW
jgi:hypothetical protein